MFLYFAMPGHLYVLHKKHFMWLGHTLPQCKQMHDDITAISAQGWGGELHC